MIINYHTNSSSLGWSIEQILASKRIINELGGTKDLGSDILNLKVVTPLHDDTKSIRDDAVEMALAMRDDHPVYVIVDIVDATQSFYIIRECLYWGLNVLTVIRDKGKFVAFCKVLSSSTK